MKVSKSDMQLIQEATRELEQATAVQQFVSGFIARKYKLSVKSVVDLNTGEIKDASNDKPAAG